MKLLKQQTPWTKERIIQFIQLNKIAASETSKTAYSKFLLNQFVEQVILNPDDIIINYRFGVVDNDGAPRGARTQWYKVKL